MAWEGGISAQRLEPPQPKVGSYVVGINLVRPVIRPSTCAEFYRVLDTDGIQSFLEDQPESRKH
jgi:hypothetical protein